MNKDRFNRILNKVSAQLRVDEPKKNDVSGQGKCCIFMKSSHSWVCKTTDYWDCWSQARGIRPRFCWVKGEKCTVDGSSCEPDWDNCTYHLEGNNEQR